MTEYSYAPYALIAVACLLFTLPATAYLLWLRPKSIATYNLIGFLIGIIISLVIMYLFNAVYYLFTPLWPGQDVMVMVALVFLVRFAYTFPHPERSLEARLVTGFYLLLTLVTAAMTVAASWHFFAQPDSFAIANEFWLFMPIGNLLVVGVFLRRMFVLGHPKSPATQRSRTLWVGLGEFWSILRHPPTVASAAQRNFALASATGLLQALGSVAVPFEFWQLVPPETFISLGTMLSLALVLLSYLNATAAQNTLIVKLVGASLILLLFTLGAMGIQALDTARLAHRLAQIEAASLFIRQVRAGESPVYPSTLVYLATYPQATPLSAQQIEFVYTKAGLPSPSPARIQRQITQNPMSQGRLPQPEPTLHDSVRIDRFSLGKGTIYEAFAWVEGEKVLEVGFINFLRNADSHTLASRLIGQITLSALLVILVLPFFFWRSLIIPLNRLLAGVKQVNDGDLRVSVPIDVEDEIGYLTRSFNSMAGSLLELNQGLEQKVFERTRALAEEILQREEAQAEMQKAKEQAEQANQTKTIFLTNMSHELRTPLNAILGYAQILQQRSPQEDHPAAIIERSGRHLLSLINAVLDLARIDAGKIDLTPEPVALGDFLQRVCDLTIVLAQAKGIDFRMELAIDPALVVLVDPTRLRQVLINLLSNAVAYTDRGTITLRAVQEPGEPTTPQVCVHFSVKDTGIGIHPQDQPLVFLPMYQTSQARRRGSGTGLGLVICSQLVQLMGGNLRLQSQPGVGSLFFFSLNLPVQSVRASPSPSRRLRLMDGLVKSVLVVDDNEDNRTLLLDMLTPLGFQTEGASDTQQALALAQSQSFDLIITDLAMPGRDGFELIQILRSQPAIAHIPIVATSASVYPEDKARSLQYGADLFLPKPVEMEQLLDGLDALLEIRWQMAALQPVTTTPPASSQLPSPQSIRQLLGFAQAGDILALKSAGAALQQQMPNATFTVRLQELINAIQLERIVEWLETVAIDPEKAA